MTAVAPLAGISVLIVEDDYYLASDEKAALESAGARVVGPCGNADEAAGVAASEPVDCAVVDVNLGEGPSFAFARTLQQQGVPFVFVTGYDRALIPPELGSAQRLEKPIRDRDLIAAVARACR
ncbi:MAG: histidine kinase [Alphaproteobacteria bacterium]|jgi:DNA-binding response OmpR family regulator|nr:histidine kinase [Alphaproteobacteria bacterium]